MTEAIKAFPLQWPAGWKRTSHRTAADFGTVHMPDGATWKRKRELTIAEATGRVLDELRRMHVDQRGVIISTNLRLRNDGLPLSKQREPDDPGVAVYWKDQRNLVIAADCYTKIADNLAAVAATLEAMRAIKRHGGAAILERAFTGFTALPAPMTGQKPWRDVLAVDGIDLVTVDGVMSAYRLRRGATHPDREGGSHDAFLAVQSAYEQAAREMGFQP